MLRRALLEQPVSHGRAGMAHASLAGMRSSWLGRLALGVIAACALAGSGCATLVGEQNADGFFRVVPREDGTFSGWTQLGIGVDPDSVDRATLVRGFLEAREGAEDLTFIQQVTAEVVVPEPDTRQEVAVGSDFPVLDTLGPMDVTFHDDLRPFAFVEDGDHKVRIEWNGTVDPNADIPEEGYEVGVLITIDVE